MTILIKSSRLNFLVQSHTASQEPEMIPVSGPGRATEHFQTANVEKIIHAYFCCFPLKFPYLEVRLFGNSPALSCRNVLSGKVPCWPCLQLLFIKSQATTHMIPES